MIDLSIKDKQRKNCVLQGTPALEATFDKIPKEDLATALDTWINIEKHHDIMTSRRQSRRSKRQHH